MPRPRVPQTHSHTREIASSLQRERPDLDPTDYLYLLYARRVGRILDAVDDRNSRAVYGISATNMRVLFALRRSGPTYALRPTELFRALLVTSGAITKQVEQLVDAGLVHRLPGPDGSGGRLIQLTKKGFKVADDALTALAGSSVISHDALTANERRTVCRLLEKMLLDLEQRLQADD